MLVDGYIREIEQSLNETIIATEINKICFQFYFLQFILDSIILTKDEKLKLFELFIDHKLDNMVNWKLLFRASDDSFDETVCHNKCENNSNILWIIHSETDNVFGAFTKQKWITTVSYNWKEDNDAFLYLLRSTQNYPSQSFEVKKALEAVSFHKDHLFHIGRLDLTTLPCSKSGINRTGSHVAYHVPKHGYLNGDEYGFELKDLEIFSCQ